MSLVLALGLLGGALILLLIAIDFATAWWTARCQVSPASSKPSGSQVSSTCWGRFDGMGGGNIPNRWINMTRDQVTISYSSLLRTRVWTLSKEEGRRLVLRDLGSYVLLEDPESKLRIGLWKPGGERIATFAAENDWIASSNA